jgi:ribonuclease-3
VYPLLTQSGPEHQKHFVSSIVWSDIELGRGEGRSKKEAEVAAAQDALQKELWKTAPENFLKNLPTTVKNPR